MVYAFYIVDVQINIIQLFTKDLILNIEKLYCNCFR